MFGPMSFLNYALPIVLLGRAYAEIEKRCKTAVGNSCALPPRFSLSADDKGCLNLTDRHHHDSLPLVSAIEEELVLLTPDGHVAGNLPPTKTEQVPHVVGPMQKNISKLNNWPDYQPERILVVYPEVIAWLQRWSSRPLDDLATFEELSTVEFGEDDHCVITCRSLCGETLAGEPWHASPLYLDRPEGYLKQPATSVTSKSNRWFTSSSHEEYIFHTPADADAWAAYFKPGIEATPEPRTRSIDSRTSSEVSLHR